MATSKTNYWKWGVLAAAVIAAFFIGNCNGRNSVIKNTGRDTTVKTSFVSFLLFPTPVKIIEDSIVFKVRTEHDSVDVPGPTVFLPSETPPWAVDMLNDYNKMRIYDTLVFEGADTARVKSWVRNNKLARQIIGLTSSDTTFEETTVIYPPRNLVGYLTFKGGFAIDKQLTGAIGFAVKTPNDRVYHIEYQRITGTKEPFYNFTYFAPIRIK